MTRQHFNHALLRSLLGALAGFAVALVAIGQPSIALARPLALIQQDKTLALCASPSALPHAMKVQGNAKPGFQVEIARAIAAGLGVELRIDWIVPRMRARQMDCDMLMDTIVSKDIPEGRYKLSVPYQRSGVALGMQASNTDDVKGFGDLKPGQRIGVIVNSVASVILGKRGLTTIPYGFEDEMVSDLAQGKLYAVASSPASVSWYGFSHPESPLRVVHAYETEPELSWNVAVGLQRSDEDLVKAVNGVLEKLIQDGTLREIYSHYGVEHRVP